MFCMRARMLALTAAALSAVSAQTPAPDTGITIRTTTALVQVGVVAHDSKGRAVTDLKKEDLTVFDNGRPQDIAVFSAEKAAAAPRATALSPFPNDVVDPPGARTGYTAILFDYLNGGGDPRARLDAVKMLEKADPAGKMALFLFDGWSVKPIADFGLDKETLLKKLADPHGDPPPNCFTKDAWSCAWMYQTLILAELESMADRLSFAPGRKALIWVTKAYDLMAVLNTATSQTPTGRLPQLEAEIEREMRKLNNADIALYPVDPCGVPGYYEQCTSFTGVMDDYAARTGGVAVHGRNDLDVAMQEAADDVSFTYSLAFYPPQEGARTDFHQLKVQVGRPGITLKYKQGYSLELPAATPAASLIPPMPGAEARALAIAGGLTTKDPAAGPSSANVAASMQLPYFYTAPEVGLVDLAMEIETAGLKFENVNGKQHVELNLDAVAFRPDGGVAGRFSDTVKLDFATAQEVDGFRKRPYRYEHQFRLAPGQYNVRAAFAFGEGGIGKVEMPLTIDGWDGHGLALSGAALAKESRKVADAALGLDAASVQGRKALIARSTEIIPAGNTRFQRNEPCLAFLEIYEPLLTGPNPPKLNLQVRVLDRQTGAQKVDSGVFSVDNLVRAGDQVVPVSLGVPIADLSPGGYRLEVKATHSAGTDSAVRLVDFDVE